MARKQKIEDFIKKVSEDNAPVKSRPIIITKKDMQKNRKRKRKKKNRQETGFICDDFEILI